MRNGGQLLVESLVSLGATKAFGVPGESYLAVLDALHDTAGTLDFILWVLTYHITASLQTLDVVTSDTHIHFFNVQIRIAFVAVLQSLLNGFDSLVDVQYLSVLNPIAVGASETKNLQLAIFVLATGNGGDLCSSDVETNNNW